MNYVVILQYPELSVKNIWRIVENIPKYNDYFPDYLKGELPDRQ